MQNYNCKITGGEIPEGEFVMIQIQAKNAGEALPLAIANYPGSIVKEITLIEST